MKELNFILQLNNGREDGSDFMTEWYRRALAEGKISKKCEVEEFRNLSETILEELVSKGYALNCNFAFLDRTMLLVTISCETTENINSVLAYIHDNVGLTIESFNTDSVELILLQ